MDLIRIKNILIVLFLVLNIFLCAAYFGLKRQETNIQNAAAEELLGFLANQNIVLDGRIIPPGMKSRTATARAILGILKAYDQSRERREQQTQREDEI